MTRSVTIDAVSRYPEVADPLPGKHDGRGEVHMTKADLDWAHLPFGYLKTDFNVRYTWKEGRWDEGVVTAEETIPMHIAATCLHYGQECFEGLKAFETKSGDVVVFRLDENAARMVRSCRKVCMEPPPEPIFCEAVYRAISANRRFVPPYGTGASLYIRPLALGTGPQIGVRPSTEYLFLVLVTPVGPYFKTGFKPVPLLIEEGVDRAAPLGVGDVKVGGNYAAGLRASLDAKSKGFADALFLDAREHKFIDECAPANFFAITKDGQYVTPHSESILPSITNKSLMMLADDLGLRPVRRPILIEELFDFVEAGCCGTAAVITPVASITYRDRQVVYSKDGQPGRYCTQLYNELTAIQVGDAPDRFGWLFRVPDKL